MKKNIKNIDEEVVSGFGDEWNRLDQSELDEQEQKKLFESYISIENRPFWFRVIWRLSDVLRRMISRLPHGLRYFFSQLLAGTMYLPLARLKKEIYW